MSNFTKHWRTSLAGVVIIGLAALNTFAGVHVPGFDMSLTAAITAGTGLIFASDASAS